MNTHSTDPVDGVLNAPNGVAALVVAATVASLLGSGSAFAQAATPPTPTACSALARLQVPGGRVMSAESVAAGALKVAASPVAPDLAQRMAAMPALCRVRIIATPTPDSEINVEVWLPMRGWNGRLLGTGNGGGAGRIAYEMGMVEGLKRGFAVTNTDLGTAPDINRTIDRPERWADFGHRATHEMTRMAKAMVTALYKVTSFRAYFAGCSTGGQQALGSAQRDPNDYDGIWRAILATTARTSPAISCGTTQR